MYMPNLMDYWTGERYDAIAVALCSLKGQALRTFIAENDVDDRELTTVVRFMRAQDKEVSSRRSATFGRVQALNEMLTREEFTA